MARRWGQSDFLRWDASLASAFTWDVFTAACVFRKVSDTGGMTLQTTTSGGATQSGVLLWSSGGGDLVYFYDEPSGGFSGSTTTVTAANGWALAVVTKTTGTVAPRFHIYKWTTNVWVHETGSATVTPVTANGGYYGFNPDATASVDGYVSAGMVLHRAMSDSECRRLARGRWSEQITRPQEFLAEFPSGRDPFVAGGVGVVRERGRRRGLNTADNGTTKAAIADPRGFRFSAGNRRS